jgi:hypothetical protein
MQGAVVAGVTGSSAVSSTHSSSTTWTLLPPAPNELTPARRGSPPVTQSTPARATTKGLSAKSIRGFARSKCSVAGMRRWRIASTVLISPAAPAAAVRWPMFDFSDPIRQNRLRSVVVRKALVSASTSIGSPSGVAVPCAST